MNTIMKQMTNKFSILATVLIIGIGLPSAACSQSNQNSNRVDSNKTDLNQTQTPEIPSGVKNSTYDSDVNWESVLSIKVAADNKIYVRKSGMSEFKDGKTIHYFNYTLLTDANFISEVETILKSKPPDKRCIYIQADVNVKFGKLTEIFEKSAKNEISDKIKFVVNPIKEVEKSEQTDSGGYVLEIVLPAKNVQFENGERKSSGSGNGNGSGNSDDLTPPPGYKPKPKTAEEIAAEEKTKQLAIEKAEARKKIRVEKLIVEMESAEKFKFNNQSQTIEELKTNLKKIFDERTAYDIFIDGTNEINKTVYLKISPNVNYGEAIKLIDEIYGLGANRVYLDYLQNK